MTSDDLFEFIKDCTRTQKTMNAEGDVIDRVQPALKGRALSAAIASLCHLVVHESDRDFTQKQLDDAVAKGHDPHAPGGPVLPSKHQAPGQFI